ncbi:MAG TPA: hypothetical protein VLH75_03620 [Longimicrobiales bacterium]|nr:hypothetical protein [Longimicrobiales bacterium]
MRTLPCAAALGLAVLLAAPLASQDLKRPEGWKVRFDRAGSTEAELETFVSMPPGWHITTGPAGIFWDPALSAMGEFRAEMEVFLFDPQGRREAFGIFFGGKDLEGPGQEYAYFVVREGGEFLVKHRRGTDTPTLVEWTGHDAIASFAERGDDSTAKNVLTVEAGADTVRFLVNGAEVAKLPRSRLPVEGVVGIRVNHALNLHVSRPEVTPLG